MKFLLLSLLIGSTNLHASSLDSVERKVELKYSNSDKVQFLDSYNGYIRVKREEVRFPAGRQSNRLEEAITLLDEIINSEEFKHRVLSYTRPNGQRGYSKNYLWHNTNQRLSSEDIYQIIMTGDERMIPGTEAEMNLNIKKYHSFWSRVIGWTSPSSSKWINVNWRFYKRYQTHQMVGNLMHEWIHLLGFLHGKEAMHEEVPYVVGGIASELAKEILAKRK